MSRTLCSVRHHDDVRHPQERCATDPATRVDASELADALCCALIERKDALAFCLNNNLASKVSGLIYLVLADIICTRGCESRNQYRKDALAFCLNNNQQQARSMTLFTGQVPVIRFEVTCTCVSYCAGSYAHSRCKSLDTVWTRWPERRWGWRAQVWLSLLGKEVGFLLSSSPPEHAGLAG